MFILYNQEHNKDNIIENHKTWSEEFLITSKRQNYLDNWLTVNELTNLKIRRIIKSGGFILTFEHINNLSEIENIRINTLINNKKIELIKTYNENYGLFFNTYNSELDTKNKFNFEDINNINFEIEYKVYGKWYQVKRFTYWIKKNEKSKNIIVNKNTNIKLLSEIEINSKPDRIDSQTIYHNVDTKYINLLFEPIRLKQGTHNKKIYDVSIFKTKNNENEIQKLDDSDIYDFKINSISLFESIKNKYEVKLNFKGFGNMEILIDSYSYHNKHSNSIIIDNNNSKSKLGLLIPLNFKGDFGYTLNFSIGKFLKDFSLIYIQEIEKPFFSLDSGLIKMKTKNIKGWLKDETWHQIKYENFLDIIKNANSLEYIEKMGIK